MFLDFRLIYKKQMPKNNKGVILHFYQSKRFKNPMDVDLQRYNGICEVYELFFKVCK